MSIAFLSSIFARELPRTIHRIEVDDLVIEVRENSKHRWLMFGNGIVQSAMSLREPWRLVLPYTQSMLASLVFEDDPRRILLLGIGGGSLIRYLRTMLPLAFVRAVDASPAVLDTARTFFSLPAADERLRLDVADARDVVPAVCDQDLILVDVFDETGMPDWVGAPAFLTVCRGALAERGILVLNLMPADASRLAGILRAARQVFDGHVLVTTLSDYRNVIVLALRDPTPAPAVAALGRHARTLERRFHLPLGRIFRNICGVNVCRQGKLVI